LWFAARGFCGSLRWPLGFWRSGSADEAEIEFAGVDIDGRYCHAHWIAQPIRIARAESADRVARAVVAVVIVRQRRDMDEALGGQFDARYEETKLLNASDNPLQFQADLVGKVVEQL